MIRNEIRGVAETKYCVDPAVNISGQPLSQDIITPAAWYPMIPRMAQGVANNQRIGLKISNVVIKTHFYFHFNQLQTPTDDIFVRVFYGYNKNIRSLNLINNISAGTLLDLGTQTSTDWNTGAFVPEELSMMPPQREVWSLKQKTVRLVRNQGIENRDATLGATPNLAKGAARFTLTTKHKSNLLYEEGAGGGVQFPQNYAPLFAVVGWRADGYLMAGSLPVVFYTRTEIFYKDV